MNTLQGTISAINVNGNLSLVRIQVGEARLSSIVIETPQSASYLAEGKNVNVLFKETEVIIGKGDEIPVSLQNRFICIVKEINVGTLLSKLTLQHPQGIIRSIITSNAARQLNVQVNDEVIAMIKTNEIMLSE